MKWSYNKKVYSGNCNKKARIRSCWSLFSYLNAIELILVLIKTLNCSSINSLHIKTNSDCSKPFYFQVQRNRRLRHSRSVRQNCRVIGLQIRSDFRLVDSSQPVEQDQHERLHGGQGEEDHAGPGRQNDFEDHSRRWKNGRIKRHNLRQMFKIPWIYRA